MIRNITKFDLIAVILFIIIAFNCGDFLTDEKLYDNPNEITDVAAENLFVAVQSNMIMQFNGSLVRIINAWMEQIDWFVRYVGAYEYSNYEGMFDDEFNSVYLGGGLIDIRLLAKKSRSARNKEFLGMAQVLEAYFIGTAAALWGDIPYSQAVNDNYPYPELEKQADVYDKIQLLLDEAIINLNSGETGSGSLTTPSGTDFIYGGDLTNWIQAAYTLKARFHLHWAKVDKTVHLFAAKAAALNGINSSSGNFKANYSDNPGEENLFYQFEMNREGYVKSGFYMTNLLSLKDDPRLSIYFNKNINGVYRGSRPGEYYWRASNINPETFASPDWDIDLISFEENQFILAECYYKLDGDETEAKNAMNAAIDGIWARYEFADSTKPDFSTLTGDSLFKEIMLQKYITLYLNFETYNDWKRTGYPDDLLGPAAWGNNMPRRLFYSSDERERNPNIPPPDLQPVRNDNDPDVVY